MWKGLNVSFRDMLVAILFAFLLVALAVPPEKKSEAEGIAPPGNVIVEVWWDKAVDADIDLWVKAPGDVPVGYSNKSGKIFNLVRDDLGASGDPNSLNYEVAYGRGHWPGEYVVNLMLYRTRDRILPIHCRVQVSLQVGNEVRRALVSELDLKYEGEEATVFRFRLDEQGEYVADSVNRIPKALRSATGATDE